MTMSDKSKYSIDNDLFFEHVRQMLDNNKAVKIPVTGTSMLPFMHPGDDVILKKALKTDLICGRIVLAIWNKAYILHRIVWKEQEGDRMKLAGDNNLVQTEHIDLSDILAVVTTAYRGEKRINIDSPLQVCAGLVWYRLRFLRRIYNKMNKIYKKYK